MKAPSAAAEQISNYSKEVIFKLTILKAGYKTGTEKPQNLQNYKNKISWLPIKALQWKQD